MSMKKISRRTTLSLASLAALALPAGMAAAQSLTIGLASEPTAADPHYHKVTTNDSFSAHIFEQSACGLGGISENARPIAIGCAWASAAKGADTSALPAAGIKKPAAGLQVW